MYLFYQYTVIFIARHRHHNKVLDTTSIIRYTGLPNNAQLEMITALKTRAETKVKVGLALESGSRVMGEFEPLGINVLP